MPDFLERLNTEVLLGFGAAGSEMIKEGFDPSRPMEEWIIDHPQPYQRLVKAWVDAGADLTQVPVITANSFRLQVFGLKGKLVEFNTRVVKIVQEVTPEHCYTVAVIGPTGVLLKPLGDANFEEVYEAYKEQAIALAEAGVDVLWVGSMGDLEETRAVVRPMKEHTDLPVIATVNFEPTPRGYRTMMGVDPATAARNLEEAGADVVGTNCGSTSLSDTTQIIKEMKAACSKYIAARPNAGVPEIVEGKAVYAATPEMYAEAVPHWVAAGASIVAACCGSTPEHIAKMAAALRATGRRAR